MRAMFAQDVGGNTLDEADGAREVASSGMLKDARREHESARLDPVRNARGHASTYEPAPARRTSAASFTSPGRLYQELAEVDEPMVPMRPASKDGQSQGHLTPGPTSRR